MLFKLSQLSEEQLTINSVLSGLNHLRSSHRNNAVDTSLEVLSRTCCALTGHGGRTGGLVQVNIRHFHSIEQSLNSLLW